MDPNHKPDPQSITTTLILIIIMDMDMDLDHTIIQLNLHNKLVDNSIKINTNTNITIKTNIKPKLPINKPSNNKVGDNNDHPDHKRVRLYELDITTTTTIITPTTILTITITIVVGEKERKQGHEFRIERPTHKATITIPIATNNHQIQNPQRKNRSKLDQISNSI